MKKLHIQSITIYGYGKLENISWNFNQSAQVFYGENEAGKTTIMSFIHSMLFGFPSKQHTELRYEPKTQYKYGGQLIACFPMHGKAVIERVRGKASGDVTVVLENGRRGQEELLAELLQGIDRQLYQSIFSFNLFGLQNVQQLKGAELGRFLFSTGAVGSDRLLHAEQELQKEMELRFRPGGKKPQLNKKLAQLKEQYQLLKLAEKKNSAYEQLLNERKRIENQLKKAEIEKGNFQKETYTLQEWIKWQPLVKEKENIERQLANYNELAFPIDGLIRWERVKDKLLSMESAIKNIETKMAKIQESQGQWQPNDRLLNKEKEISEVLEQFPLVDQWISRQTLIENQINAVDQEIMELKGKMHITEEDALMKSNTSMLLKEQCKDASIKQRKLMEQKRELDHQYHKEQTALASLEEQTTLLKNKLLSREKRLGLETKANAFSLHAFWHEQMDFLKKEELEVKQQGNDYQKKQRQEMLQGGILLIFLMMALAWGFWNQEFFFAAIGAAASIIAAFFLFRSIQQAKREQERWKKRLEEVIQNRRMLEEKLNAGTESEIAYIVEKLQEDDNNKEQYNRCKIKLEQQNDQYEKVLRGFEKWEYEHHENTKRLLKLANELHISKEFANSFIYDAFLLIEEWKKKKWEKDKLSEEWNALEENIKLFRKKICLFYKRFFADQTENLQTMCFHLKQLIKEEQEKSVRYRENMSKLEEYKKELEGHQEALQVYLKEKEQLFTQAKAENEEEFRKNGHKAEERNSYKEKLSTVSIQLERSFFPKERIASYKKIENPAAELEKIAQYLQGLSKKQKKWLEELAAINFELEKLETGGTYTEILHAYKQLKIEFEEDGKEWGKYAAAKQLLAHTVKQYKNQHLPKMLKKAEEYFAFLTEGNYIHIIPKDKGAGFLVESKEHLFFEANELSQGTAEQLYAAIRLALVQTFYAKYKMPIMIDDSFVNFDRKRTGRVMALLKSFQQNQLLLFTCHPHIAAYFSKEEVFAFPQQSNISGQ